MYKIVILVIIGDLRADLRARLFADLGRIELVAECPRQGDVAEAVFLELV